MMASLMIANGFWSSISEKLGSFFQHWATQDILLVAGLGFVTRLLVHAARSDRWRRAWLRFKIDRTGIAALVVVCIYLFIGALETFRIPNGNGATRSLLDVVVGGIPSERSYSAPFANKLLTDTSAQPDPLNSSMH